MKYSKLASMLMIGFILAGCSYVPWHQSQYGLNCGATTVANAISHLRTPIDTHRIEERYSDGLVWWDDSRLTRALISENIADHWGYGTLRPEEIVPPMIIKSRVASPVQNHYIYVYGRAGNSLLISDSLLGTYQQDAKAYSGFYVKLKSH